MIGAAVFCLAMNLYWESRGEPTKGQVLVAYVTLNRAHWKPQNVCEQVFASKQFSWANGKVVKTKTGWALHESLRPKDHEAWQSALRMATIAITLPQPKPKYDPSKGATHYHATYVDPDWDDAMVRIAQVGQHVFYRERR
jgi:N-acetylmuramoyl-L-alanine amidase